MAGGYAMSDLSAALAEYLALRRSLGYKLERAGELLADFVAYVDRAGADRVTVDLAVRWATLPANADSTWRAQRLGVVRCFARYLQALEPETEIPPACLLFGGRRRPAPLLCSDADLAALMAAARTLRSPLQSITIETLIGLLAVTGLRVGEAIRLNREDVDVEQGLLMVCNTKAGKSRAVPLHPSTIEALEAYSARRDQLFPSPRASSLFISTTGTRLLSSNLGAVFADLQRRAGLQPRSGGNRGRLRDLRHGFAVTTLLGWHTSGVEVEPRLPLLSTYLGHVNPASTYWYLSATPELLAAAAERLDATLGELP
jgi:integrase/recombinase XerD